MGKEKEESETGAEDQDKKKRRKKRDTFFSNEAQGVGDDCRNVKCLNSVFKFLSSPICQLPISYHHPGTNSQPAISTTVTYQSIAFTN